MGEVEGGRGLGISESAHTRFLLLPLNAEKQILDSAGS